MADLKFFDANMRLGPDMEFIDGLAGNRRRIDGSIPGIGETLGAMKDFNIYRALVRQVLSYQYDANYGNELLMKEIKDHPNLTPVFMLYPTAVNETGDTAHIYETLRKSKAGGVLLYPGAYRFKAGGDFSAGEWSMGDIYDMLESIRIPVFTRLNADLKYDDVDRLLNEHPNLRLVLREVGLNTTRNLFSLAREHDGFYFETTDYKAFFGIEDFVAKFGSERLVFGSGYPTQSVGGAVTPLLLSKMKDTEKENIAFRNLERITGEIKYGE